MGTKEQHQNALEVDTTHSNANTTTTTVGVQAHQQQQQQQQQRIHLPRASPSSHVIIIPATQASTVATNAAKKIRRAFSMPPFRWSRKFKTAATQSGIGGGDSECGRSGGNSAISSCVGGGRGHSGSIVSLSSYDAVVCKDSNGKVKTQGINNESSAAEKTESGGDKITGKVAKHASGGNNNTANSSRVLRRSSFRKFLNRIAQHVSSINVGANKLASSNAAMQAHTISNSTTTTSTDRVPPIGGCYQWPADQTPGVMGLKNHGNTCFMNAVLQCLSHTDILAEYFVLDQYKADLKRRNKINSRKFGTKGELTEQLANVLKALWTCKNESDHSTSFKAVVDRYGSQFRSSTQHDAQEFLFWLLDKVHEDLNTATKRRYKSVKNNYGRPDEIIAAETLANHIRCNNSFVQAVFQAQFRSSLTCPRCKKQSNTFDPFHCVSVQLPQLTQQTIFVTVVYLKQHPRQVKLGLTVPAGSPIVALREQLTTDTGIASECMVLVDINKEGFTRVFYDTQPVATLRGIETIYCIEVPEFRAVSKNNNTTASSTTTTASASKSIEANTAKSGSTTHATDLLLLVANVRKKKADTVESNDNKGTADSSVTLERFGTPFSMQAPRDCSYTELQKKLLREMSSLLKPEVFSYATPLPDMFQIRLQDPSADPDTYLEQVAHPLLTEMIDLALSVLSAEAGPAHIKLLLEWPEPEQHFADLSDIVVEHESVARLLASKPNDTATLTLEQCLEHYTKAETLSAEDAWRCPHCQQYLPVVKTLGLWSLPDILVVHFKRFRQHQEKGQQAAKLTTMVKFPLNAFDMSPHLARDASGASFANVPESNSSVRPSPWKKTRTSGDSRSSTLNSRDNRETRYDLYAVCYHQGDTLETGHYTAACRNPYDHQWYKFDDQRVSKVPANSIQEEIINNEAYMLFYQRRTGEAAEYSGSSSNSGDHWVSRIAPPATLVPIEKLTVSNTDEDAQVSVELEKLAEKVETKPVEIPKVSDLDRVSVVKEDNLATGVPKDMPAQMIVIKMTNENELVDIEELDYADADIVDDVVNAHKDDGNDEDELQALERLSNKEDSAVVPEDDANRIFVMDEDCPLNEATQIIHSPAPSHEGAAGMQLEAVGNTVAATAIATKTKTSPLLTAAAVTTTTTKTSIANGHEREYAKPNGFSSTITKPRDIKSHSNSSNTSSASSTSSLSSRSSPHSLAVSVHGASTLQSKFNGFATSNTSASNNYKEALLSSSLKSNSSSFVGTIAGASHEFQLARHHWNGSRSSVSALENTSTQQAQHHTHCLNLRHSFSTSSNYKLRECSETLSSMLRNSANTCSKDTLIYIDQQSHHHHHHNHHSLMEDDDDTFMGSRSLWISPVTPHKLITVSPKN